MIDNLKIAKQRYNEQKYAAHGRGIQFSFTFEQWWDIWDKSGHWEDRGCRKDQYVMSRIGDTGSYEVGNVFIQTQKINAREGHKGKKLSSSHKQKISDTRLERGIGIGIKASEEARRNMSIAQTGRISPMLGKTQTEEAKQKISAGLMGHVAWNKGRKLSQEEKDNISNGMKRGNNG